MTERPAKPAKVAKRAGGRSVARREVSAGEQLRRSILETYELDLRELRILDLACAQADDVARLEAAVAADGVMVAGAAGQRRLNAAVTELRNARLALARLLGELALPADEDAPAETAAQRRARKAAMTRWNRRENVRALRGGSGSAS